MSDVSPIMKWLDELARYFENRDTGGEDRAHWANVYNSENALKVKAALAASEAEVSRLREALRPFAEITPSSGVAPDGLDNEPYQVFLACRDRFDFTGRDLARARAALTGEKP